MDSDLASTAQEEGQSHDPPPKTTGSKRKFASQVQFENLQATVADMRSEMAVLISLVKESVSPPKKLCLDGGSQSASQSMATFANNENQFLDASQGNQFAIPSCGDQFSTMPSGSLDFGQTMPMALNPASPMAHSHLSTESTEGSFVPTFHNMDGEISNVSNQGGSGDSTIHFVEDESLGPKISEGFATYVEDCCRKRILNSEILKLKDRFQRPANCPALSVPTVNPDLWAQLPREQKEHDKRLQNAQSLLSKGLTGVVQVKETLLQFNSHPDKFLLLFKELFDKLDASVALLGNAFLESSYRRRDLLKAAIHPRFHSLCSTKTPITNYLFGGNMLETAKSITSSQKMTRSLASTRPPSSSVSRPPFRNQYPPNRPQQSSAVFLNYRGHTNNAWRSVTAISMLRGGSENSNRSSSSLLQLPVIVLQA